MPSRKVKEGVGTHRRLIFDIEVSPNIGWFWKPTHYMRVNEENIILPGGIICICWKWAGEKKVYALTWDRKHDEGSMLRRFVAEMGKADEIITHNGEKFDIVWLRTRCALYGVPMAPDYVSIDTFKEAKYRFNFMSNKLSHIAKVFGLGEKVETGGAKLWKKILMGEDEIQKPDFWHRLILGNNPEAMKHMVEYCKHDVVLLEQVFEKMNPYIKPKSHFGLMTNTCPECGSHSLLIAHRRITAAGSKRLQLQCKDCGKYQTIPESKFDRPKDLI